MSRKPVLALASLALLLLLSAGAQAEPITVTFEGRDPLGPARAGGLLLGGGCPSGPLLHICFGGGRIGPSGAAGNNAFLPPTFPTGFTNIQGWFINPTPGASVQSVSTFVAFDIVGSSLTQNPFYTVSIYDANGNLIASETGTTDRRVTFSFSSPTIGWFVFFPGGREQGIDNLTFETTTAPEPATLVLLGTGLAGIVAKVRRRRKV